MESKRLIKTKGPKYSCEGCDSRQWSKIPCWSIKVWFILVLIIHVKYVISKKQQSVVQHQKSVHDLIQHQKSAHEGKMYPCEKCDYKVLYKGDLIRHPLTAQSESEIRYSAYNESIWSKMGFSFFLLAETDLITDTLPIGEKK